jgi:hypothetical protein
MSDLAPFVAALLRDRVIRSSRKVRISGLGGEIYAEAQLDEDGHALLHGYWHIYLKPGTTRCSSMEQFRAIELHIGDLHKVVLASNAPDENYGYFNVYEPETRRADISVGTFKGVCLFASIGPISQEDFEEVPEKYDHLEIMDVFSSLLNGPGDVTLDATSFTMMFGLGGMWDHRG